jgi:hypothetical protein
MPRPKLIDWAPKGLADNPIPCWYSDKLLDDLIQKHLGKHLGIEHNDRKQKIRKQLRDILGVLWFGLHNRERPTGGSKLVALKAVGKAIKKTLDTLEALDADSRLLLEASGRRGYDERFDYIPFEDDHYGSAIQSLSALYESAERASQSIDRSPPGRTNEVAERTAVVRCRDLMKGALPCRRDPSPEELRSFLDDLCGPLRDRGLLKGSLAGHIQQALYQLS